MKQAKLQTIAEFMRSPLNIQNAGAKQSEYDKKYELFKRNKKLKIEGFTSIGDNYFIHMVIPSDSNPDRNYDVIVKFSPPDGGENNVSLRYYHIQFFSNSPGFIYKYSVLYKEHGLLIEELYNKMDPDYMDTLPSKTNTSLELSYDKSIYFVCRFLSDHQFRYLSKVGPLTMYRKTPENFFRSVSSFKKMKALQEFDSLTKKVNKSYAQEKLGKKIDKLSSNKNPRSNVKTAQKHTSGLSSSIVKRASRIKSKNKITGKSKLPKR